MDIGYFFLILLFATSLLVGAQSQNPASSSSSPIGGFGFGTKDEEPTRVTSLQFFLQNNMAHYPGIELSSTTSLGASYYAAEILDTLQQEAKIVNQSVFSPVEYIYTLSNLLSKFQTSSGGFVSTISSPPPPPPSSNPSVATPPSPVPSTLTSSNDSIPTLANTYFALRLLAVSESEDLRHSHSDSVQQKLSLVSALSFLHSSLSTTAPEGLYALYPGSDIVTSSSLYHGQLSFAMLSQHLSPAEITTSPPPHSDSLFSFLTSLYHSGSYESSSADGSSRKREIGGFSSTHKEPEISLRATFECLSVLKSANLLDRFFERNPNARDQLKTFVFAHRDERTAAFESSSQIVRKTFSSLTSRPSSLSFFGTSDSFPDGLSTVYALEVLNLLNSLDYYLTLGTNRQKLLDFLLSLQRQDGGFALSEVGRITSYESTFAAVRAFGLSSQVKYLYQRTSLNPVRFNTQPLPGIVVYLWALLLIVLFSAALYFFTGSTDSKKKKSEDSDESEEFDDADDDDGAAEAKQGRKRRENRMITVMQDLKTAAVFDIDGKNITDEGLLSNMSDWEVVEKEVREGMIRYRLKLKDSHHHAVKKAVVQKRTKKGR